MILNVERREFLTLLAAGRVYRSDGGRDIVELHPGDNRRCEKRLKEWTDHDPVLAVLDGRYYKLTEAGLKLWEETR